MIVCEKCGRRGVRGFVILRGNGDGTNDQWICAASWSCRLREEKLDRAALATETAEQSNQDCPAVPAAPEVLPEETR